MQSTIGFEKQLEQAVSGIQKAVLVSTFMRSGTHLTIDLIRKNFPVFRSRKQIFQNSTHLYFVLDTINKNWFDHEEHRETCVEFLERSKHPIFKAHFLDPEFTVLDEFPALKNILVSKTRTVYVTRDLFRVLPSLWSFFETAKIKNPNFNKHIKTKDDFVEVYAKEWADHLNAWIGRPNVLLLRFEDIISSPDTAAKKLASHFDEPLPSLSGKDLLPPKNTSTFLHRVINYVHPNPLSSEIRSMGKAAKDKLVLTPEQRKICLDVAGSMMEKLGYYSNN